MNEYTYTGSDALRVAAYEWDADKPCDTFEVWDVGWLKPDSWGRLLSMIGSGFTIRYRPVERVITTDEGVTFGIPVPIRRVPEIREEFWLLFDTCLPEYPVRWDGSDVHQQYRVNGQMFKTKSDRDRAQQAITVALGMPGGGVT